MKGNLQQALDNTEQTYAQLVVIANEITNEHTREINADIRDAVDNINNLTNDSIRQLIINLALKSYSFSEIKEKSVLKAECAEALRKEAYAVEYNKAEGAVALRDNLATINISDEILTEAIYNLVCSLFKTKLDEIHRVIDALKTVLMSRMAEAKLSSGITSSLVGE